MAQLVGPRRNRTQLATTACEYRHKARKNPERKDLYIGIAKSIIATGKKLKKYEQKRPDPSAIIYCQADG